MDISVAAFFDVVDGPPGNPYWEQMRAASETLDVLSVAGEHLRPFNAQRRKQFKDMPGLVLGYVFSRADNSNTSDLRPKADILADVADWYQNYPDDATSKLDGIYFDNAVLYPDAGDAKQYASAGNKTISEFWEDLLADMRTAHPARRNKTMILAGQCPDDWVLRAADYVILWETEYSPAYTERFWPLNSSNKPIFDIPGWWKDPANRVKIHHTVHTCLDEVSMQDTVNLAREYNGGRVYVIDDVANGYDHLAPYWVNEVGNAASYNDYATGLTNEQLLRGAHRWATKQGALHGWPNFEQAWYSSGHKRGTFTLENDKGPFWQDVELALLPGQPPIFDVASVWWAAHTWARSQPNLETAMPTFEVGHGPNGTVYGMICFPENLSWLHLKDVPRTKTYEKPGGFAATGRVARNVHRWSRDSVNGGHMTGFPIFDLKHYKNTDSFSSYMIDKGAPVKWQDVDANDYAAMNP